MGEKNKINEPIIYFEIEELGTEDYAVLVASIKPEDLPQYAIQHRKYKVVEFANENLSFVKDWLNHFVNVPQAEKEASQSGQMELLPGELPLPKIKAS